MSPSASPDKLLYLSRADVASVDLPMTDVLAALEIAFDEKGRGRIEMPPKPGIHPGRGDNFIHAMLAQIPALQAAGIKWVSGYPENHRRGLPYITGLLILNDPENGLPLAIMDCEWITAVRTGAATALAARYLAREDSRIVGILACGVQGRSNLEALTLVLPLERVRAYDVDRAAAERFATDMSGRFELTVEVVDTPRDAVVGCDVVVTSGPILRRPHATIQPGWLDRGAFASLVDFDSYWHRDALAQVDKFCTDDTHQLEFFRSEGYFQAIPPIHADLGELVTGAKHGRQAPQERTLAVNLGLAIDDIAVAPRIYRGALERGIGTWLDR